MPIVYGCIQPRSGNSNPEAPKTAAAVGKVMQELGSYRPEVIIVIAAPSALRAAICVSGEADLREHIAAEAKKDAVPVDAPLHIDDVLEPLLRGHVAAPTWLWIMVARLELRFHFEFGRALGRAIRDDDRRIALVCLAELSHTPDARAARAFDEHYRRAVEGVDVKWLAHADPELRRRAGESAAAQTAVLFGALGVYRIQTRLLSYERTEDRSYLVATIDVLGPRRRERKK